MSEPVEVVSSASTDVLDLQVRAVRHGFSLRAAAVLSFATMRPIYVFTSMAGVAVAAGIGSWLAIPICYALMLLVAAVFGEMASRWPLDGSAYEWTRQLIGPRTGLLVGWAYLCSYIVFMAAISYPMAAKFYSLISVSANSQQKAVTAAALVLIATAINLAGRAYLKVVAYVAAAISLVGALVFGTILLVGHRQHPFSSLWQSPEGGAHGWSWLTGPFLIALIAVTFSAFRGTEIAAEVAEEVKDPERSVPKAMIWSLVASGAVVLYTSAALLLAIPEASTSSLGSVTDAVWTSSLVVQVNLGVGPAKVLSGLIILAFFAVLVIFQMAASRTLWTTTRDRVLPAHNFFGKLTAREGLPHRAIIAVGVVAAVLPFLTSTAAEYVLWGVAGAALLLVYLVPIIGAGFSRVRGTWHSGPWSLGGWGLPVIVVTAIALLGLITNLLWPRSVYWGPGNYAWGPIAGVAVIIITGLLISVWAFREGGIHTRHYGHVDRDLQRIRLTGASTCAVCLGELPQGSQAQWDEGAHAVVCLPCDEMADLFAGKAGATDNELTEVFMKTHLRAAEPSASTLRRIREHAAR